jgi:hypothetical protein
MSVDREPARGALREHFREQIAASDEFGSPFSGRLLERMLEDLEAGGIVAELVADWPRHPRADAVAIRLIGALHAAVLMGRDAALAAQYPAARPVWDMAALWPIARTFLVRERAWVERFIASPPQTNEVRRSIALLLPFLRFARAQRGPLDLYELGASAGMNLLWDRFRYRTASWSWAAERSEGDAASVAIDTVWDGPSPPLDAKIRVRSRAACDLSPLDLADAAQRLRLRSYIWADQRERLARFDAAASVALAAGVHVEAADAAEWLPQQLASRPPGAGAIVYHSVFLQYVPRAKRDAIRAAVEAAGERATEASPLAWVRLEPEALLGGAPESARMWVDTVTWPGGRRTLHAVTDGHVRAVQALPES